MPPASKKFFANSVRAREVGELAEIGEEHLRPRAGRGQHAVGGVAQLLERLGEPDARQRREGGSRRARRAAGATSSTCTAASWMSGNSLVPVSASRRRATSFSRSARVAATLRWIRPLLERRRRAAGLSRSPGTATTPRAQSCAVRSSMPPAPAAGSVTFARFDSSSRMSCVLRAMRRAKRSGRPSAGGERQHRDGVRAAEAGRERRDGGAQHVHPRIAPRHHAPRGLGRDEGRRGREAAGLLDARPQLSQMARNFAIVRNWSASAARRK